MQQLGISGLDAAIRMTQDGDGAPVSSRSIWNCQEQQHAQTDECNQPKVGLRRNRSMNPTYHKVEAKVTVASLANSSMAAALRSLLP
ncbi:hypothetical protein, partial [Pseudomonas putida]